MASTVVDIPNDILVKILQQLDSRSLKNARCTSRRFAAAGAISLFPRVYFAPHPDIMKVFTFITSKPLFAVGVTELIYDARLFWKFWTKPESYCEAYKRGRRSVDAWEERFFSLMTSFGKLPTIEDNNEQKTKQRAEQSCTGYTALYKRQQKILDTGLDFRALCQGLLLLPNLTKVSFIQDFDRLLDFLDLHDPLPCWYGNWSRSLWKDTCSPISWHTCREMRSEAMEEDDDDQESPFVNALIHHPWDWRGIANCLKAVSLHGPKVNHLHYGSQSLELPVFFWDDHAIRRSFLCIAKNLHCIKLDLCMSLDPAGGEVGAIKPNAEAIAALEKILKEAQNLTTISFAGRMSSPIWERTFGVAFWPNLSFLELGDTPATGATLTNLCLKHKDTLAELRLRNIHLDFHNGTEIWEDVVEQLQGSLKLRKITFYGLSAKAYREDTGSSSLGWKKTNDLGRQMMAWVPSNMLEMKLADEEDTRMSIWHK